MILREFILNNIDTDRLSALKEIESYLKGNASLFEFSDEVRVENNLIQLNDIDPICFKVIDDYTEEIEDYLHKKGLKKYVIAGGAVANIIYSAKNGCDPIVNDIDVFVLVPIGYRLIIANDGIVEWERIKYRKYFARFGKVAVHSNLKFLNTEVCGRINYVYIEESDYFELKDLSVSALIDDFDLNCTKAVYYRGEIRVTKSFLSFLQNKEIIIENEKTLVQSIQRILKKENELPGSFYLPEAIYDLYGIGLDDNLSRGCELQDIVNVMENAFDYEAEVVDEYECDIDDVANLMENAFDYEADIDD